MIDLNKGHVVVKLYKGYKEDITFLQIKLRINEHPLKTIDTWKKIQEKPKEVLVYIVFVLETTRTL